MPCRPLKIHPLLFRPPREDEPLSNHKQELSPASACEPAVVLKEVCRSELKARHCNGRKEAVVRHPSHVIDDSRASSKDQTQRLRRCRLVSAVKSGREDLTTSSYFRRAECGSQTSKQASERASSSVKQSTNLNPNIPNCIRELVIADRSVLHHEPRSNALPDPLPPAFPQPLLDHLS